MSFDRYVYCNDILYEFKLYKWVKGVKVEDIFKGLLINKDIKIKLLGDIPRIERFNQNKIFPFKNCSIDLSTLKVREISQLDYYDIVFEFDFDMVKTTKLEEIFNTLFNKEDYIIFMNYCLKFIKEEKTDKTLVISGFNKSKDFLYFLLYKTFKTINNLINIQGKFSYTKENIVIFHNKDLLTIPFRNVDIILLKDSDILFNDKYIKDFIILLIEHSK